MKYFGRNKSIDLVKGILIFFVIIGHVLYGGLNESIARWIIYGFHMPLFMGVSGYLFDMDKYSEKSFAEMARKYLFRIIIPWICAVNVYYVLNTLLMGAEFSIRGYIYSYIQPYYHLWFAVAYTAYVFVVWIFLRLMLHTSFTEEKKRLVLLVGALVISVIWKFISTPLNLGSVPYISLIQYHCRPWLFCFFILGMFIKKTEFIHEKIIKAISMAGAIIGSLVLVLSFYIQSDRVINTNFFILNFCLVFLVCNFFKREIRFSDNIFCRIVEFVGRHSYAFYLWHVLLIVLSREIF